MARAVMPGDPGYGTGPDIRRRAAPKPKPKPRPKPKPKARTPQYGPSPQRVRSERRERETGQVVTPSARRYVGSPKQKRDIARERAKYRKPAVDPEFAKLRAEVAGYEDRKRRNSVTGVVQAGGLPPGLTGGRSSGLGDVLANFGGDVVDVVTGVPSAVVLAGKTTAYPFMKLAGQEGAEDVEEDIKTAGKAIRSDFGYRYGGLARGDFGEFWERAKEHPGLLAMDVAGVTSAAGAGVRLGAKAAGAATGSRALQRTGSKAYGPGTARYRQPRRLRTSMSDEAGIERARATTLQGGPTPRPYSANPMTRGIQKGAGRLIDRAAEKGARASRDTLRGKAYQARVNMAQRRQARDYRMAADMAVRGKVDVASRPYREAAQRLTRSGKWSREQADMAAYLHSRDLLNVPGKTARQAANDVAALWERSQSAAKAAEIPQRVKNAARNPQIVRSLPDELLDLKKGPAELRTAVDEYRKLATSATAKRVEVGTLTSETAQMAPKRVAQIAHEGLEYKNGRWVGPDGKPVESPKSPPKPPPVRVPYKVPVYEGSVNIERLRQSIADDIASRSDGRPGSYELGLADRAIRELGAAGAAKKHRVALPRYQSGERTVTPGGLVENPRSPYSGVGREAVYVKDIPADKMAGRQIRSAAGAFGRRARDPEYASTGRLFREGNVQVERGLPIKSMERAVTDEMHPRVVRDLYDTIAFRNPTNGKIARGPRAAMAFRADPKEVTLVSVKSLRDARRAANELPDGEMPDSPFSGVEMLEGKEGLQRLAQVQDRGKDFIAVPTAAIKGMREGWESMVGGQRFKWFDTPQSLWKRGILALAPRWYFNSLIGNTLMYGMATGGDLRSVVRVMRNQKLRDAVPGRIKGATNVQEARTTELATANRLSARYRKITDPLIKGQSSFDALFRKALYVRRVRQGLRVEGAKVRGLSPDDFAEAVRTAPKHVVEQAMRETELFLGDYLRLSPLERASFRRVFPFFSWMRVIGRFMLEVPVRHPKRAALTAIVSRASAEAINPDDYKQNILANRGRIIGSIPGVGPVAMRTAGPNPGFTHADIIKNVTGRDAQGTLQSLASNLSPIGLQQAAKIYSGRGPFGAPVSFPPGYGGTASEYGKPTTRIDPVTGQPDYFEPSIPLESAILDTIPLAPQIARGVLSGDRQPYDVTTLTDLIDRAFGRGKSEGELFKPRRERAMEPFPYAGPFLGWSGVNLQRYDRREEEKAYRKRIKDRKEAERQTKRRKRKVR